MSGQSQIEQLIQGSLKRANEKVAAERKSLEKQAQDTTPQTFDASVSKLARALEMIAEDPRSLSKISMDSPHSGSNNPEVQPPTDEERNTTSVQPKDTTGPSKHTAQHGSETEPGTDEDRDTHRDNSFAVDTVKENPSGVPEKVAGADNMSAECPEEYASGEGTPISQRIPFLSDASAAIAFNKRQAKQVSAVGTLSSLFDEPIFRDPVVHRNLTHAEESGTKMRPS